MVFEVLQRKDEKEPEDLGLVPLMWEQCLDIVTFKPWIWAKWMNGAPQRDFSEGYCYSKTVKAQVSKRIWKAAEVRWKGATRFGAGPYGVGAVAGHSHFGVLKSTKEKEWRSSERLCWRLMLQQNCKGLVCLRGCREKVKSRDKIQAGPFGVVAITGCIHFGHLSLAEET